MKLDSAIHYNFSSDLDEYNQSLKALGAEVDSWVLEQT